MGSRPCSTETRARGVAGAPRAAAWRLAVASVALLACTRSTPVVDAGGADAAAGDAGPDGGATELGARVDGVMAPAFAATPASLDQCVGGVAVVVTPGADVVRGWGATRLGGAVVPDEATLFQIGSLTKVFTGVALARRVEDGDVTAETSAGALLAADLRDAVPAWPSLGALVSHHAGLPDFPVNLVDRDGDGVRDPGIDPWAPAAGYDRANLRAGLAAWSPPPSPAYLYSNVGIGVVGLALEDRLGVAGYHEALRQLITQALGMDDTWGELDAVPAAARGRFMTGYALSGPARAEGILARMGALAAAGEVVTSGRDVRRWLRALVGLDQTVLAAAIARATTPLADGPSGRRMGYALEIEDVAGVRRYRKVGTTASYTAFLLWSTEPAVGVAVLTGCGGFRRAESLAQALYDVAR